MAGRIELQKVTELQRLPLSQLLYIYIYYYYIYIYKKSIIVTEEVILLVFWKAPFNGG